MILNGPVFFLKIVNHSSYSIKYRTYAGSLYRNYFSIFQKSNTNEILQLYNDFFNLVKTEKNPSKDLAQMISRMAYLKKRPIYYLCWGHNKRSFFS